MAALNRPTTASYETHEKVSVDTQGACVCAFAPSFFVAVDLSALRILDIVSRSFLMLSLVSFFRAALLQTMRITPFGTFSASLLVPSIDRLWWWCCDHWKQESKEEEELAAGRTRCDRVIDNLGSPQAPSKKSIQRADEDEDKQRKQGRSNRSLPLSCAAVLGAALQETNERTNECTGASSFVMVLVFFTTDSVVKSMSLWRGTKHTIGSFVSWSGGIIALRQHEPFSPKSIPSRQIETISSRRSSVLQETSGSSSIDVLGFCYRRCRRIGTTRCCWFPSVSSSGACESNDFGMDAPV